MKPAIPPFSECVKEAEVRLSELLVGKCLITVHHDLSDELLSAIETIDHEKFREELWYNREEFTQRKRLPEFLCITASLNGKIIAFDYGYKDKDKDTFYSDTTATLMEGKGIGSTLFSLEIIHSYEEGYMFTKLSTEEVDEKGRHLQRIWSRLGFKTISADQKKGIEMRLRHTANNISALYDKYISAESLTLWRG